MDLLKPKAGRIFSARPVMCCPNMPILLDLKICSLIRTWMYRKLPAHEELTVPVRDGKNTLFWILRDFKRPIFVSHGLFVVNLKMINPFSIQSFKPFTIIREIPIYLKLQI